MNTELSREILLAAAQANARAALAEDVGSGDISAHLIPPARTAIAHIITRTPGVFCGQLWVMPWPTSGQGHRGNLACERWRCRCCWPATV